MRIAPRLLLPLTACAISLGAAVIGGACVSPTHVDQLKLDAGVYVLTSVNGVAPPATFVDATRTLRVLADTFTLNASTQYYDEAASVAITPKGGVEQPVSRIAIGHQPYTMPSSASVTFIVTAYGASTTGPILTTTSFQLQMPDNSFWRYEKR